MRKSNRCEFLEQAAVSLEDFLMPLFRILIVSAFASGAVAAAAAPVSVVVKPDLVRQHFAGPGFQCEMFLDSATKEYFDQVLAKRWRELNPGCARVDSSCYDSLVAP